jgi:lipase
VTGSTTHVTADDGAQIAVEVWPARRPDAPTALGIHGFSFNRLGFAGLADQLAGEVELVAIDCRGRGLSDKPADPEAYGMRRHADDAAAVLRALGRSDVVVVGTSMGAWISTQLAANHPDLVRALVLVDGGYLGDLPEDVDPVVRCNEIMAGLLDRLDLPLPSADIVMGAFKSLPLWAAMWDDNVEAALRASLVELPDGSVVNRLPRFAAEADCRSYFTPREAPYVRSDLARITCPAHLLRAPLGFALSPETMAPLISEEDLAGFQRELPQLTVDTFEGMNHYSINISAEGMHLVADAVRKALTSA